MHYKIDPIISLRQILQVFHRLLRAELLGKQAGIWGAYLPMLTLVPGIEIESGCQARKQNVRPTHLSSIQWNKRVSQSRATTFQAHT